MKCFKKDFIEIKNSKEYGASYALLEIARALEMDKMIYSESNREKIILDMLGVRM